MSDLVRKIGVEKIKVFNKNPDYFFDYYKEKALSQGYRGDLKFVKEKGNILIFVQINHSDNDTYEW
jgi:hypothetical protein